MANNFPVTPGSGDSLTGVDISSFSAYPTTGKVPASVLYVGPSTASAPTPLSNANPLPVSDAGGSLTVDGTFWQATQPISAAALPLPSGAATSALQGTTNTSLGSIDGKLPALSGGSVPVVFSASEAHLGELGGRKVEVAVEITRPADTTAYAAGDSVNTSTSAPTIITFANFARVVGGSGYVIKARLVTDKKSITPRFRVHLFNAANPQLTNDNAALIDLYADDAKRIGYFDLPALTTAADTTNSTASRALDYNLRLPFGAGGATRSIYALLETLDAFTPASGQKFTLTLAAELD